MLSAGKMETFTRIGFAARGLMYFLIGYLALKSGRTEDGSGILNYLNGGSGKLLLALMALGFLAYGIWRLSEAAIDSEGNGTDTKGIFARAGGALSGILHLGLSFYAFSLASGRGSGGSGGGGTAAGAQTTLSMPGGQALLGVAAAALILIGVLQLVKAYRAGFLRHLKHKAARQDWVKWVGRAGYAARGIVFLIMGWFLLQSARQDNASRAGDMGDALGSLPSTLQYVVAAGLLLFGIFSVIEAIYRRINDPHVVERLKGAARAPTQTR